MFHEPAIFTAEQLHTGLSASFEREITEEDINQFARNSGDANPLHVDATYASTSNFAGRIVHGAFQIGLASALVGMHLPGRNVLVGGINAKFPAPLYYPCRVQVSGQVVSWNRASQAGSIRVTVREVDSQTPTADVFVSFTLHERRESAVRLESGGGHVFSEAGRELVLVTGAAGGIGARLVAALAKRYSVVAMVRRHDLDSELKAQEHVLEFTADLQDSAWPQALTDVLRGQRLYGVVHAAWGGAPHGSLLQVDPDVIQQQINFGVLSTISLAQFLFTQDAPDDKHQGGRLIALGSIYSRKPMLSLASYSLGKTALEHTAKLLAPELARRQITINIISPSFIATGMNKQSTERQQMKETASVPMGRLCQSEDVAGLVQYLLSPEAAFVSGQVIGLDGAQL